MPSPKVVAEEEEEWKAAEPKDAGDLLASQPRGSRLATDGSFTVTAGGINLGGRIVDPATSLGRVAEGGKPYSQVLAQRRKEAASAATSGAGGSTRKPGRGQEAARHNHWSNNDSSGGGTSSATGTSIGGQSDGKLTAKQLYKKYAAKVSPKNRLYMVFAMVEAVIVALFFLGRHNSHRGVILNFQASAADALNGVHEAYTKKVFQMRNLAHTSEYNWDVQQYLAPGGQTVANTANIQTLLGHIRTTYRVEYAMIVSPTLTVMASANANDVGDTFNPEGILDKATERHDPVWTYGILKYEDFAKEAPPMWRDRESNLDEAFAGGHPYENQADSLVHWVAQAVRIMDFGTLEPVDAESAPVAYLLLGDVVNGKSASTTLIGMTLAGMAGVYHRRRNPNEVLDAQEEKKWLTASATVSAELIATTRSKASTLDMLMQGYSPFDSLPEKDKYMDYANAQPDGDKSAYITETVPYMTALRKWHPDDEQEPTEGRPPVALGRGLIVDLDRTSNFMRGQFIRLVIIVATDLVTLFLATWLFLLPLEAMGRRVRNGQHVDIEFLRALTTRRKYVIFIAIVAVFSVLVGVDVRMACATNMDRLVRGRNSIEPGMINLAYRQGVDQGLRILTSMQVCTALKTVLSDGANNPDVVDFLDQRLAKIEETIWVEFALLYGSDGKLLAVPRNRDLIGTEFDPSGIVADTLETGHRYTRSGLLSPDDLTNFNVKRWVDSYFNTTPVSHLHPSETGEQALVRWASVPVWIAGPASTGRPDGVLVVGDVVNGKTRIVERANKMVNHGYTAIYMYNDKNQYQLVSSVIRQQTLSTVLDVDIELPDTAWLDKLRHSTDWHKDEHYTVSSRVTFDKYHGLYDVSARCINKATIVDEYGARWDARDWRGDKWGDCMGYMVQGIPWQKVLPSLLPCYRTQFTFVFFCAVKACAMAVLCYAAYLPFKKIVLQNKFVQSTGPSRSQNSVASTSQRMTTSHFVSSLRSGKWGGK